jgi:dihydrodipicolinate synthase/N-acetylneuraminate lyase
VLAAAVTPLREGGEALDDEAFAPYVDYLADSGLNGLLALGTTGEGILLSVDERRRAARLFIGAAAGRLQVAVHCGAQTTAETVALAADAAEQGADAVAVIGPPYYTLDEEALVRHFAAAAEACRPLPFYLYEFRARTGYSIPLSAIERLRESASNLAGIKVSNAPFDALEPYLIEDLDVFVGAESLVLAGLERGAAGAVSGLAAAFPELVVSLVRDGVDASAGDARAVLDHFPFQAAAKYVLRRRGLPVREDVRAPLRPLARPEQEELDRWLASS